ncbi:hypothetical protein [Nonomuraea sp. NPDC050783]|uniref:hypothetical protein n=1 Tax=Nonomuraea sp. NPDC050783 TaxID=3154634 RepID=UPI003467C505
MTAGQDLAPTSSEPPKASEAPEAPETAEASESGEASETSETSEAPETPEEAASPSPSGPAPSGPAAAGGAGRRRVTRVKVMGAVAAMLVAALAATAVLQWVAASRADQARESLAAERALRLEVSGAASAFSTSLLSYDYRDLQTTRATLSAQATGDFLATYDSAFGGAMAQVIVKLKAVAQATVREVYLADVDEATAHAIVVVDQQVNTSEAIRSVKDSHLKIALVKEKGVWKVRDVTVLGAASDDQYALDGKNNDSKNDGEKKD